MDFKLLHEDKGLRTYALVYREGDEMLEGLKSFIAEEGVQGASFTAIGALKKATLGYFDTDANSYRKIFMEEQVEVLSLVGNVAMDAEKDQPRIHAHMVIGREDGSAHGGHVFEAHVRPTLEVVLVETPSHLRRYSDPKTGLALISIDK